MKTGDKVYVKTLFLEGEGTVLDLVRCSTYPIQVELDQGDDDGHKLYRFSCKEVKLITEQKIDFKGVINVKLDKDYIKQSLLFLWAFAFTFVDFYKLDVSANPIIVTLAIIACGILYYISGLTVWIATDKIYKLSNKN